MLYARSCVLRTKTERRYKKNYVLKILTVAFAINWIFSKTFYVVMLPKDSESLLRCMTFIFWTVFIIYQWDGGADN
jgi:hypothetical protein